MKWYQSAAGVLLGRFFRVVSLVLLAAIGTVVLMRTAPGYFTDAREADPRYSELARVRLESQEKSEASLAVFLGTTLKQWMHGDLGRSREYDVPVQSLLAERTAASAMLLLRAIVAGWMVSLTFALPLSARTGRSGEAFIATPMAVLLAVPIGALATLCLMTDFGGPLLVLTTVIAAREFKLIYRLLRQTWSDPCLLHGRAQGLQTRRLVVAYLLPRLRSRVVALASMSFVLALSALVPVEVIFNVPGVGQLAFSAAMNRDLPVLLAVTMLMASCVGVASLGGSSLLQTELA